MSYDIHQKGHMSCPNTVLESIKPTYLFILETNGILLGYDKKYVEDLSTFENLHVRLCLKGADSEEFTFFTGAKTGFEYQLVALQYLRDSHMNYNIALVSVHQEKKQNFFQRLVEMDLEKVMIEEEEIKLYPMLRKRLQKEKLLHYFE